MNRTPISIDPAQFPEALRPLLEGAALYDSSSSPEARVYFIDKEDCFYLKAAPARTLETEARLTRYFHGKGLAAEMLYYATGEKDWLLTRRLRGEDCTHRQYLDNPKRLCDTLAQLLRMLHDTDPAGCPVQDRNAAYLATASRNYRAGCFDQWLLPENRRFGSAEEAWRMVEENSGLLKADALLHGDYCLPNILLDSWKFTGFIDLGGSGIGDRHIDLFWGIWSLQHNLKTDRFTDRFLDAYGRELVEIERLRLIDAFEVFG